jgi:hypothetical protein
MAAEVFAVNSFANSSIIGKFTLSLYFQPSLPVL